MCRRIRTARLMERCLPLDSRTVGGVRDIAVETTRRRGRFSIAVAGGPGCGKTEAARILRERGFPPFKGEELIVIDDLRGPGDRRYRKRDVTALADETERKALVVLDYRACLYLRNADLTIIVAMDEERRLANLRRRSARSAKRYGGRRYGTPPAPRGLDERRVFVCRESLPELLGGLR